MSNKQFGLAGIGPDVQLGKAGPRLVQTAGVFQAKDALAAALARFQAAEPVSNADLTTKLYVDSAISLVQTELNTTQAALGLTPSGALPVWSGVNYVGGTTTLLGAITTLDARAKANADSIAALGNAFNYVGTLAGGSSGAPFDLSTLAADQRNTGDYFKVSSGGWFKVSSAAAPFYANTNDGLVKNSVGNGWDVIDNTDATVTGTVDRITVTGSVDTGYAIDLAANYVGQTSIHTLGSITTGTWDANTIAVAKGGTGLTSYASGDILYATGATTLERLAKGTSLQFLRMNAGATAPEYATLVASVIGFSDEGFDATDADAALIELKVWRDATNTGAGLNPDGTYTANATSNYLSGATSLRDADNHLDAAIKAVATNLATLSQDQIVSPDAKSAVKATNTQLEFYGNVSGAKTLVGAMLYGAATNARYELDVTTANTVVLRATGTQADVNLTLAPKGAGAINASSARVANVANPTNAQDAMTLAYADDHYLRQELATIGETNSSTVIADITGTILRIRIVVTSPWGPSSTVTIGSPGDHTLLTGVNDIDLTQIATYIVDNVVDVNATIGAYVSGVGSGTARIVVEYIPG